MKDGFLGNLIRPLRDPSWSPERETIGNIEGDLSSVAIAGLAWLESTPAFETVVTHERGGPLQIVAVDPRVFAAHKLWISRRPDRDPTMRRRDVAQAVAVDEIVARRLTHLPYDPDALRMIPRAVFEAANPRFAAEAPPEAYSF